jgi:hypothetical protein
MNSNKLSPKAKIAVRLYEAVNNNKKYFDYTPSIEFSCEFDTVDDFLNRKEFSKYSVSELEYMLDRFNRSVIAAKDKYAETMFLSTAEGKAANERKKETIANLYKEENEICKQLTNELNDKLQEKFGEGVGCLTVGSNNLEIGIFCTHSDKNGEKHTGLKFGHSFSIYMRDTWLHPDDKDSLEVNFGTMGNFCVKNSDPAKVDTDYIRYVNLIAGFCSSDELKDFVYNIMKKVKSSRAELAKKVQKAEADYNKLLHNINVD